MQPLRWQEAVMEMISEAPVTLVSTPRAFGATTLAVHLTLNRSADSNAVILSNALEPVQNIAETLIRADAAFQLSLRPSLTLRNRISHRRIALLHPDLGQWYRMRPLEPSLVVLDGVNTMPPLFITSLIDRLPQAHLLLLGTLISTSDAEDETGSGWFKYAFRHAYERGWNAFQFNALPREVKGEMAQRVQAFREWEPRHG